MSRYPGGYPCEYLVFLGKCSNNTCRFSHDTAITSKINKDKDIPRSADVLRRLNAGKRPEATGANAIPVATANKTPTISAVPEEKTVATGVVTRVSPNDNSGSKVVQEKAATMSSSTSTRITTTSTSMVARPKLAARPSIAGWRRMGTDSNEK